MRSGMRMGILVTGSIMLLAVAILGLDPVAPPAAAHEVTCDDFATQADAQQHYRASPTAGHVNLDMDRDGVACDDSVCPCDRIPVRAVAAQPTRTPTVRATPPAAPLADPGAAAAAQAQPSPAPRGPAATPSTPPPRAAPGAVMPAGPAAEQRVSGTGGTLAEPDTRPAAAAASGAGTVLAPRTSEAEGAGAASGTVATPAPVRVDVASVRAAAPAGGTGGPAMATPGSGVQAEAAAAQQARCADYPSQAAAQVAYRANPTGLSALDDPDADTAAPDGIACETNPPPCDLTPVTARQQVRVRNPPVGTGPCFRQTAAQTTATPAAQAPAATPRAAPAAATPAAQTPGSTPPRIGTGVAHDGQAPAVMVGLGLLLLLLLGGARLASSRRPR